MNADARRPGAIDPRMAHIGIGLLGIGLQQMAFIMVLFGDRMMFLMLASLGVVHLALVAWLIAKGLAERKQSAQ